MKRLLCFCLMVTLFAKVQAQNVTITPNGITPASGGLTIPRISYAAILDLPSPQSGDMAYDTTFECLRIYSRGKWLCSYEVPGSSSTPSGSTHPNMAVIATAGVTEVGSPSDMVLDNAGNIYIIGSYKGTSTFGSTTITSNGDYDIFVAKYDKSGVLKWVKSGGGTSQDSGNGICVDASGNVYVTGRYKLTATFGSLSTTTAAASSMFILKYNSNGIEQWIKSTVPGGTIARSEIFPQDIAIDSNGDLYITGGFYGYVYFDSIYRSTAPESSNAFITKCDNSGNFQWVKTLIGFAQQTGYSLALDNNNNLYVTGIFTGSDVYFGSIIKSSYQNSSDVFLAKYNSSGVEQWVQTAGGSEMELGSAVYVDSDNKIYLAGQFEGTTIFGASSKTSLGGNDIFLTKYDSDGNLNWVQFGGSSGHDASSGITVDDAKNVFVTGYLGGSNIKFDSITKTSDVLNNGFVTKYNSAGAVQWFEIAGGPAGLGFRNIGSYGSGILFLTGSYGGTVNFGTSTLTSQGIRDFFIAAIQN